MWMCACATGWTCFQHRVELCFNNYYWGYLLPSTHLFYLLLLPDICSNDLSQISRYSSTEWPVNSKLRNTTLPPNCKTTLHPVHAMMENIRGKSWTLFARRQSRLSHSPMELWIRIVTIVLCFFFVLVRIIRYVSKLLNSDSSVTTGTTLFQKTHKHPPALPPNRLKLKNSNIRIITHIALILSGDIQLNPGPCSTIYPSGICEHPVTWSDVGPCCDGCNIWYHKSCIDLYTAELDSIGKDNMIWLCCKCKTPNHSSTLFHAFEIDLHNNYSILNDLNNNSTVSSITSLTAIFQPQK